MAEYYDDEPFLWKPAVWRDAHRIAEEEWPRILSGLCQQPGLASIIAIKAIETSDARKLKAVEAIKRLRAEKQKQGRSRVYLEGLDDAIDLIEMTGRSRCAFHEPIELESRHG